jgi:hypothetical protein
MSQKDKIMPIGFTINIPVRDTDAESVVNAFIDCQPYNNSYQPEVQDFAGNIITNPVTQEMYVEDCIAYYIMDITRNYLVSQAAKMASEQAKVQADALATDLKQWIESQPVV